MAWPQFAVEKKVKKEVKELWGFEKRGQNIRFLHGCSSPKGYKTQRFGVVKKVEKQSDKTLTGS